MVHDAAAWPAVVDPAKPSWRRLAVQIGRRRVVAPSKKMNVHPHIFQHPKFIGLKRRVPLALECLARLWGFCQNGQRGENLGKVNPGYVESICCWTGPEDQLFTALTECGWIRVSKCGDVIVHHWNKHNSRLLTAWKVGRAGGRPKTAPANPLQPSPGKPDGNPRVSSGLADGNPRQTRGKPEANLLDRSGYDRKSQELSHAETPSLAEVLTWGDLDAIPAEVCEKFYLHYEGLDWTWQGQRIRHPRLWLKKFWINERRAVGQKPRKESAGSLVYQKKTRMEALEKLLEEHPAHPNANYANPATVEQRQEYTRFMDELKGLRRELAEGVKA
jgi:hypothetical protein